MIFSDKILIMSTNENYPFDRIEKIMNHFGQNIRPNKIPKKYQKKINRFLKIIDILFGD